MTSELSALYYELGNLEAKLVALKEYAQRIDEKADELGMKNLGNAMTVDRSCHHIRNTMQWLAGYVNASLKEAADYGFIDTRDDELER